MRVLAASKGSRGMLSPGSVDTVVPAQVAAVALLRTRTMWLEASSGSTITTASSAPPKPVSVYVVPGESKSIVG